MVFKDEINNRHIFCIVIFFFSDVTYSNPCKLKAAVCKNNLPGLAVAYNGMCAEKEPIIEAQGYI